MEQTIFNSTGAVFQWIDMMSAQSERGDVAFRGMCDAAWTLRTSLDIYTERLSRNPPVNIEYSRRLEIEDELYREFATDAMRHLPRNERNCIAQGLTPNERFVGLTVARHYGLPTRLLDWTETPHVALFFAASRQPETHGAIWWFRKEPVMQRFRTQWRRNKRPYRASGVEHGEARAFDIDGPDWLSLVYLQVTFPRMEAQRAFFYLRRSVRHGSRPASSRCP